MEQSWNPRVLGTLKSKHPVPVPSCQDEPCLSFEAVAEDVTPAGLQDKPGMRGSQYARAGGRTLNVTSERIPGEYMAMRLRVGHRIKVSAYACETSATSRAQLPADNREFGADGAVRKLTFYSVVQDISRFFDDAQPDVPLTGYAGIWTDSISVHTSNVAPERRLVVGNVYKVVIEDTGPQDGVLQ